jgi:hypothetical protein
LAKRNKKGRATRPNTNRKKRLTPKSASANPSARVHKKPTSRTKLTPPQKTRPFSKRQMRVKTGPVRKASKRVIGPKMTPAYKQRVAKTKRGRFQAKSRKPGRQPSFLLFENGQANRVRVTLKAASTIGAYLYAVRRFLDTNDPEYLSRYAGRSVKDRSGKKHAFETRPNVLYRLNAGIDPFEDIYRKTP